jgi:hypothetical protein
VTSSYPFRPIGEPGEAYSSITRDETPSRRIFPQGSAAADETQRDDRSFRDKTLDRDERLTLRLPLRECAEIASESASWAL